MATNLGKVEDTIVKELVEQFGRKIVVKKGGLYFCGDNPGPIEMLAQGEPGKVGPQGPRGLPGERGERGLRGEIGPKGDNGVQGNVGPQGERGPKGEQGPIGKQGTQGERGLQGLPGERGEQGLSGKDGQSIKGPQGGKGDIPAHEWDGTKLRFQNPDGTWGEFVDLQGRQGISIKGDPGRDGMSIKGDRGSKGDRGDPGIAPFEVAHLTNQNALIKAKVLEICKRLEIDTKDITG
jgi:hypothetical protein